MDVWTARAKQSEARQARPSNPARLLLGAALLWLPMAGLGCGDDGEAESLASEKQGKAVAENEVPGFLTAPPSERRGRGGDEDNGERKAADAGSAVSDSEPTASDSPPGEGNGEDPPVEAPRNERATEEKQGGENGEGAEEDHERATESEFAGDGWSALVEDFPEPPPAVSGGGAASPEAAAKRYLTFLCTGDLELYVTTVNPAWLEEVEEDDLRELREEMARRGLPTEFEVSPPLIDAEVLGSERYAAVPFVLHFPRDQLQRGTLWVENLGDEENPRWFYSDRPRRE